MRKLLKRRAEANGIQLSMPILMHSKNGTYLVKTMEEVRQYHQSGEASQYIQTDKFEAAPDGLWARDATTT